MTNEKNYKPLLEEDLNLLRIGDVIYHCDTHEPFIVEKVEGLFVCDKNGEPWAYKSFDLED